MCVGVCVSLVLGLFFFLCLFVTSGVAHVCIFHVKEAFSPTKRAIHSNTHKERCQRAQEESQGV